MADQPAAGHPERMADRDRAAVDVELARDRCPAYRGNRGIGWRMPRSVPTGRCRRPTARRDRAAWAPRRPGRYPFRRARTPPPESRDRCRGSRLPSASAVARSIRICAEAPSESWLALPAVMVSPGPVNCPPGHTVFSPASAFGGGAGANAFILRHGHGFVAGAIALLVEQRLIDRYRHDLLGERAGRQRRPRRVAGSCAP